MSIGPLLSNFPPFVGGPLGLEVLGCLTAGIDTWIALGRVSGLGGGAGAGGALVPPGSPLPMTGLIRFLPPPGLGAGWSLTGSLGYEVLQAILLSLSSLTFATVLGTVTTPGTGVTYSGTSMIWTAPPAILSLSASWTLTGSLGYEFLANVASLLDGTVISPESFLVSAGVGSSSFANGSLIA